MIMPSRVEEYLQRAAECEKKARQAEEQGIGNSFRRLAEHWRRLATIIADKSEATIPSDRR
jgi:alanyl-tRNA synthetase